MISEAAHSWLKTLGDRINPILVKETRQALKSRQFSSTFLLLLLAGLIVSFGGVVWVGPDIDYRASGPGFFTAYFAILAFAIFLVVPFSAFRSLVSEQEERTYELLAITTLAPAQIVWGKLLAAVVQMFIYYSAISPFLAFTYLLKGIDVPSILFVLGYSLLAGVGLSLVGILVASLGRSKNWQVLLSVLMVVGPGLLTIMLIGLTAVAIENVGAEMRDRYFWIGVAAFLTAYLLFFALFFQLSVAQLTFEADNRSSKVRAIMTLQFLAVVGWLGWVWVFHSRGDDHALIVPATMAAVYLGTVGSFLAAEPQGLSQRVQRQVPRSRALQAFTTLFFPGPGTGLAFLLLHLLCLVVIVGLAELTMTWVVVNPRTGGNRNPTLYTVAVASYVFFYVGLSALLVRIVRRFYPVPIIGGWAIAVTLVTMGSLIPSMVAMMLPWHEFRIYRFWQITDPFVTLGEVYGGSFNRPVELLVGLPVGMALFVFLLNLPTMGRAAEEISRAGRRNAAALSRAGAQPGRQPEDYSLALTSQS